MTMTQRQLWAQAGGRKSKRGPKTTLADYETVKDLSIVKQMDALKVSRTTVLRLRRQFKAAQGVNA